MESHLVGEIHKNFLKIDIINQIDKTTSTEKISLYQIPIEVTTLTITEIVQTQNPEIDNTLTIDQETLQTTVFEIIRIIVREITLTEDHQNFFINRLYNKNYINRPHDISRNRNKNYQKRSLKYSQSSY